MLLNIYEVANHKILILIILEPNSKKYVESVIYYRFCEYGIYIVVMFDTNYLQHIVKRIPFVIKENKPMSQS